VAQGTQLSRRTPDLALPRLGVALPATVWLLAHAAGSPERLARPALLAWVAVLLALQLLPPPAWGGPGLSVAFAVQVALAMLYDPPVAGAVAFLGALDLRLLLRRPLAAWSDCGVALVSVTAGGALFHAMAEVHDPLGRLLPAFVACAALMWLAEVAAGTAAAALETGVPPRQLLARMNLASPYRFPATFPGMGWFGLPVARLYLAEGFCRSCCCSGCCCTPAACASRPGASGAAWSSCSNSSGGRPPSCARSTSARSSSWRSPRTRCAPR
jgi:hypothetical protein